MIPISYGSWHTTHLYQLGIPQAEVEEPLGIASPDDARIAGTCQRNRVFQAGDAVNIHF